MRAKTRVLILVGLVMVLATATVPAIAAPADVGAGVDRAPVWSEVPGFDWVHGLLQAWFGNGGEAEDVTPAAPGGEISDPGLTSLHAADEGDDGNVDGHWDPNG